ncbi:response regulator transcription factor [Massilia sp. YIM B04103]|uniref:response regulator n=1 Tax=Massilia sp. YIM B04103 TaxID=2963106 RepID=UPI00210BDFE7|nr:response regulator transcription factor [Massilia sp. YIM B04103]
MTTPNEAAMTHSDRRIRIMLVDDHKTLLWGLGRLIDTEAAHMIVVGTARDCASAVELAAEVSPDVVLLDIDLGGACSLDIVPALLADQRAKVLVLSGTRDRELLDKAVMSGVRGVVSKDEPAETVIKAIEKVHEGELWLDRAMMGRVFEAMRNPQAARRQDPELDKIAQLTAKEKKICSMIAAGGGAVNKALAQQLFISEHTLRNHLTAIYHKLGVSNRLDLYVFATRHRLDQHEA